MWRPYRKCSLFAQVQPTRNVVLKREPMRGVLTEVGCLLGLDLVVGEEAPAGSLAVLLLLYGVVQDILLPLALRVLPAGEYKFCKNKKQRIGLCNSFLKGQCHEILFLKVSTFLSVLFCVCTDGFQGLSKAFHFPIQLLTFYLLLWNYLLIFNFENAYRNPPQNSLLCDCLVPTSHWLIWKCARINLSQTASGMSLQNHWRLPVSIFSVKIDASGSLKQVTLEGFKIRT